MVVNHDPASGPGQLLVEVTAAGVNYIDTYYRSGAYPIALPFIPGAEGAGIVAAVGPHAGDGVGGAFTVGDRVAWVTSLDSYAEQAVVPAEQAVRVPQGHGPPDRRRLPAPGHDRALSRRVREKERLAREAGAAEVIRYTQIDDLAGEVRRWTPSD
jgi:NADPH:quinone reductase